jgi:large subunit ribosomal protein L29
MAIRHAGEFRAMNDLELASELEKRHQELFNLRFQLATRQQKNHQRVKTVRHEIARILTVARERELQALYDQAMGILHEDDEAATTDAGAAVAAPPRRGLRLFNRGS